MNVSQQERDTTRRRVARKEGSAIIRGKYKQKKNVVIGHGGESGGRLRPLVYFVLQCLMTVCAIWSGLASFIYLVGHGRNKRRQKTNSGVCNICHPLYNMFLDHCWTKGAPPGPCGVPPTSFALKKTKYYPRNLWPSFAEW